MLENTGRQEKLFFIYVSVCVGILFYFFIPLRSAPFWGDITLYVQHTINIVNLESYSKSGYIFNPQNSFLSPQNYPPVYPALLVPVYMLFGVDYLAFRIFNLLLYLCLLFIVYKYYLKVLPSENIRKFVFLLIALCPWYFIQFIIAGSDFSFLLFCFIALLMIDNYVTKHASFSIKYAVLFSAGIGLVMYLSYGSRTAAIALAPTFLSLLVFRKYRTPKIFLSIFVALGVFGAISLLQGELYSNEASYVNMVAKSKVRDKFKVFNYDDNGVVLPKILNTVTYVRHNIPYYITEWQRLWANGVSKPLRVLVVTVVSLLVLYGMFTRIRRTEYSIIDLFFVIYLAMLLVIPFRQQSRYLIPLIPMIFIYFGTGLENLKDRLHKQRFPYLLMFLIIITMGSYLGHFIHSDWKNFKHDITSETASQLFSFIKAETEADTVIMSIKPRIVALYTNRRSMAYSKDTSTDAIVAQMRKHNIHYAMLNIAKSYKEPPVYRTALTTNPHIFRLVYMNREFALYEFLQKH